MITIPVIAERCAGMDVGKRGLAVLGGGSSRPRGGDHHWVVRNNRARLAGVASVAPPERLQQRGHAEYRVLLDSGEEYSGRGVQDHAGVRTQAPLTGSYLPERGIVELRALRRRRKKLIGVIQSEKNRMQKVVETANVKLGNVVSDVLGVSGQEILQALLENQPLTSRELANLAKDRLRQKIPQWTEALEAHQMNDHHGGLMEQSIRHAQFVDQQMEELAKRIEAHLAPYHQQFELLMSMPGIKEAGAANILAEIGPRMDQVSGWRSVIQLGGDLSW